MARNELIVVQGHDHPLLLRRQLAAEDLAWVAGVAPEDDGGLAGGAEERAAGGHVKTDGGDVGGGGADGVVVFDGGVDAGAVPVFFEAIDGDPTHAVELEGPGGEADFAWELLATAAGDGVHTGATPGRALRRR